ncbi:MAG: ISAzo13 family transposase, partial [Planctomycetaceae bacterium]
PARSVAALRNSTDCLKKTRRDAFVDREPGGPKITPGSDVEKNLKSQLETRIAGDPDDEDVIFTDVTPVQLEQKMAVCRTPVSDDAIRKWLKQQGIRLRKIAKTRAGGTSPDRDAQFQNIARLIDDYQSAGNPFFSVDTKAKEFLGTLFRKGRSWCSRAPQAFDHDFPSWADGVLIPHGIYDPVRNRGHINLGLSRDTSEFARDSLLWYWNRIGLQCYPNAESILLLFDCGGSNAATKSIVKYDLQQLADSIGVPIRVAHYPSYCSKYNLIERRLFPHVSRSCSGQLFDTLDRAVSLMRNATTKTGLRTTVNVIRRVYETGRNATDEIKQLLAQTVKYDTLLPKWNYTLIPQT